MLLLLFILLLTLLLLLLKVDLLPGLVEACCLMAYLHSLLFGSSQPSF
jgi:hypothetical protein